MPTITTLNKLNITVMDKAKADFVAAANAADDEANYLVEKHLHGYVVNVYVDGHFVLTL